MAALSHFHLRPTAVSHNQHRNQNARVAGFVPVRSATRFRTTTGPGAPPLRSGNVTRRTGLSFTALAGFGSTEGAGFQKTSSMVAEAGFHHWRPLSSQLTSYHITAVISLLWVAATLPILAAAKVAAFHKLMLCLGGRGKIFLESSSKINLSVPQKLFWHFYVVGVVWTTFLLLTTCLYAQKIPEASEARGVWKSVFLLVLMEAQVVRRLFESVCVFKYSPSARMHVASYLTGIFYYVGAPLSLCSMYSMEVLKLVERSFVVGGVELRNFDLWRVLTAYMGMEWYVWAGAAVFLWGWLHQRRCHAILGSLRKNNDKIDHYAIPRGDWFEYVSSPHYLAEIVIFAGLVIASGLSDITVWFLFGFVMVNLTFTAIGTHKWYLGKFDNYPKNRFAIFPFVC